MREGAGGTRKPSMNVYVGGLPGLPRGMFLRLAGLHLWQSRLPPARRTAWVKPNRAPVFRRSLARDVSLFRNLFTPRSCKVVPPVPFPGPSHVQALFHEPDR